jgi:hypothetical protein
MMSDFHREPTRVLENQHLKLEYLVNSARIVRFSPQGKKNMFAEMKKIPVQTPFGDFYFRGGHRLWHAPENMPRTYIPDNEGAVIRDIPDGVRIEMPPEPWTYIVKVIEIELTPEKPQVIVRHQLRNAGAWAIELAPWALTMFRQGGIGIFPQPVGNVDASGLLPNRRMSLWPYMKIDDPRLILKDDFILVQATPGLPPLKFGYFNPHGWVGYWLDGFLFIKRFEAQDNVNYPDNGCNVESYCDNQFIELESLGNLSVVVPGQTVFHTERWELHETLDVPFIPLEVQRLIVARMAQPSGS